MHVEFGKQAPPSALVPPSTLQLGRHTPAIPGFCVVQPVSVEASPVVVIVSGRSASHT
jgi:hypothetical protein